MQKDNKKHTRRIKNLVVIVTLTAIIISVSTYAWFIGMQAVNIASFEVEIESTDSLLLSLDGAKWSPELTISKDTLNELSYSSNTNNWGDLIPMSTTGAMDITASRMVLYEKTSFTATPGGYRLLASRVDNFNTGKSEQNGYVVFDLFVRNFSGRDYISALNPLDEEAIYLTTNSEVKVASGGVANTGLENSVRVAFAQIGRVEGTTTDAAKITGMDCVKTVTGEEGSQVIGTGIANGVTGICRQAEIWEPNDTAHVDAAISWYNTSCVKRVGADVTLPASYSGACGTIQNNQAYPTYVVNSKIGSANNVDIYDGAEYNTYSATTLLSKFDKDTENLFTDSMKDLTGVDRPSFMTLAPNSVTKLRVYIYIEGQDIDNYDFSSIGKKISVAFGFTKERFTDEDISYSGPDRDTTRPVITVPMTDGKPTELSVAKGSPFVVPEDYSASDDVDGNLTSKVVVDTTEVNTATAGRYRITYSVEDNTGNLSALVIRYVNVTE